MLFTLVPCVPVVPATDARYVRDIGWNTVDIEELKYLGTSMPYYDFLYYKTPPIIYLTLRLKFLVPLTLKSIQCW